MTGDPICIKCASQQEGPVPTECACGDYPTHPIGETGEPTTFADPHDVCDHSVSRSEGRTICATCDAPIGETGGTDELVETAAKYLKLDDEMFAIVMGNDREGVFADIRFLAAAPTSLRAERDLTVSVEQQKITFRDKLIAKLEQRVATLVGERETIRVEALEEVAGLAIPAYSYDVAGVRTGSERFRKQLQAYAAKARAALATEA